MYVTINPSQVGPFHVSVPSPWYINPSAAQAGCVAVFEYACADSAYGFAQQSFVVWTTDPEAPAVNLTAEAGMCP
jgi:hypothetical protein